IFTPAPKSSDIADSLGLQNRARQYFVFQPLHVLCRIDGHIEEDSEAIVSMRQSLQKADKGRTWWNLTRDKALVLQEAFESPRWDELLYRLYELGEKRATSCFSSEVQPVLEAANKQIDQDIARLCHGNGESNEIHQLKSLQKSLAGWQ